MSASVAARSFFNLAYEEVPYGVERGSEELVRWAITDNGDVCYWVISASDDPDEWLVTVNEARGAGSPSQPPSPISPSASSVC